MYFSLWYFKNLYSSFFKVLIVPITVLDLNTKQIFSTLCPSFRWLNLSVHSFTPHISVAHFVMCVWGGSGERERERERESIEQDQGVRFIKIPPSFLSALDSSVNTAVNKGKSVSYKATSYQKISWDDFDPIHKILSTAHPILNFFFGPPSRPPLELFSLLHTEMCSMIYRSLLASACIHFYL